MGVDVVYDIATMLVDSSRVAGMMAAGAVVFQKRRIGGIADAGAWRLVAEKPGA
jgi:hypothetical protein